MDREARWSARWRARLRVFLSWISGLRRKLCMVDVVMPQMGESIVEGTLTKWLKKTGDKVERDEPLFEISTDKVDTEIPSPAAGVLGELLVQEGQTVQVNAVVARINENGAAAPSPAAPAAAAPPPPTPAPVAPVVAAKPATTTP